MTKFTLSNAEHTTGSKDRDKMLFFKLILLVTAISFISYFLTTTIVDAALAGRLDFYFSAKTRAKEFLITKANRIDFQDGFKSVYNRNVYSYIRNSEMSNFYN